MISPEEAAFQLTMRLRGNDWFQAVGVGCPPEVPLLYVYSLSRERAEPVVRELALAYPATVIETAAFAPALAELAPPAKRAYVAGFLFADGYVALVRKSRPAWQAGLLNGIGGKIEDGETPSSAMVREFREETGVVTTESEWVHRVVLEGDDFVVHFFSAVRSRTARLAGGVDEPCFWVGIDQVSRLGVIPNLQWLIPLCLDKTVEFPITIRDVGVNTGKRTSPETPNGVKV